MAEPLHSTPSVPAVDADHDDLLARFASGDELALAMAYERHSSLIHTVVRGSVGTDRAPAVTQQVFVAAWHDRAAFTVAAGPLSALLLGVTLQVCGSGSDDPEVAERVVLTDEFARLSDQRQRILELMLGQRLSHEQTAALLGLPATVVRTEVRSALDQLHDRLVAELPRDGAGPTAPGQGAAPHLSRETVGLRAVGERPGQPHEAALDDAHLATCARCRTAVARLTGVVQLLRSITPRDQVVAPPPTVWAGIADELHLWPAPLHATDVEPQSPTPAPRRRTGRRSR